MADRILEVAPGMTPHVQMVSEPPASAQTPNIASLTVELSDQRTHHARTVSSLENKLDALRPFISNLTSRRSYSRSRHTTRTNKYDDHICWSHGKCGDKAKNYVTSCKLLESFSLPKRVNQAVKL